MSSETGLDTHLGGLGISHLTDEDNVGGLTEHGTDDAGEIQSDVVPDLDLVDPWQVVLDGVFGRDDLAIRAVQCVECRVKRRGLARTGRTCDQKDTIRPLNETREVLEVAVAETELLDPHADVVAIQEPHNARLSVVGRNDRDA